MSAHKHYPVETFVLQHYFDTMFDVDDTRRTDWYDLRPTQVEALFRTFNVEIP